MRGYILDASVHGQHSAVCHVFINLNIVYVGKRTDRVCIVTLLYGGLRIKKLSLES